VYAILGLDARAHDVLAGRDADDMRIDAADFERRAAALVLRKRAEDAEGRRQRRRE
jgi:hypothetical protein